MAFCESENLSLRHKVNELEKLLKITDQNCVTNSSSRRNSNENLTDVQTIDIYTQVINLILEPVIMEINLFLTYF